MTSYPYHSGIPSEAITRPLQEAATLAPLEDFAVAGPHAEDAALRLAYIRSAALLEERLTETSAPGPTFWVHFHTDQWRPTHLVTIRCRQGGWTRDIYGLYRFGLWNFELPKSDFPAGITMKFVLNGTAWMQGPDRNLTESSNHHFWPEDVIFEPSPPRFAVPYENLLSLSDRREQDITLASFDEQMTYDVIVVGSGMGGGILADRLSDRGIRTMVLEAGGLTFPSHINNLPGDWENLPTRYQVFNFENKPGSQFIPGIQMGLGGRSVFWSGLIPRMREWELQRWPAAIGTYLTSDGYDRAERLMRKRQTLGPFQQRLVSDLAAHFPDYTVSDLPRSQHQPNLGPNGVIGDVLESPTGTFSTADLLLDSLAYGGRAGRDNLVVNLNHLVTRVEATATGEEHVVAVCQDLVGNVERRFGAKYLVLCAGSIESARIALRSNLTDPNQRIGKGLTDHPAYFSHPGPGNYGYPIPRNLPDGSPHPYGDTNTPAKILMQPRLSTPTQDAFNVEVLLNGWYWDVRHSDDDLRNEILQQQTQAKVKLTFSLENPLNDANEIELQGDDRPVALYVAPSRPDKPFHGACKQFRNRVLDFFQIANPDPNQDLPYGNQGTPHHAGGSLRMSDNKSGVVDEYGRFDAYTNLYACDISIFPAIPCANPSLTLAALALRLADHLASKLGR
jgi:hypothetical protein